MGVGGLQLKITGSLLPRIGLRIFGEGYVKYGEYLVNVGRRCALFLVLTGGWVFGASHRVAVDSWMTTEKPLAIQYLLDNISPPGAAKGAVVASPSRNNPDYFYTWVRDSSIVAQTVLDLLKNAPSSVHDAYVEQSYRTLLDQMVDFSRGLQALPPQGEIGGLGEPKYLVTGQLFTGGWGRPQNDGPAVRAIVFAEQANLLLDSGQSTVVGQKLYRAEMPASTLVKEDLEYVSHHWSDTCFDSLGREPWPSFLHANGSAQSASSWSCSCKSFGRSGGRRFLQSAGVGARDRFANLLESRGQFCACVRRRGWRD